MALFNGWPWANFQEQNLDWLITKVKEYISKTDELEQSMDGVHEYINQALSEAGLTDIVSEQMQQLVDSGYFDSIISDTMVSVSTISACIDGSLEYTRAFDATAGNIAQVNGGVYNPVDGFFYEAVRALDSTITTILKIDPSTWTIVDTYDVTAAGHCNSLAWTPDEPRKIYIISGSTALNVLDLDSRTLTTGTLSGCQAIYTGPDNLIYGVTANGNIYSLSGSLVKSLNYTDPVLQDALYYAGSLYLLSDVAIYQYNLSSGALIASSYLPDKIGGRYIGEAENITMIGSQFYLGSYIRNILPQAPTRSAMRIFRFTFVPSTDYASYEKPSSVNLSNRDDLWIQALDYRGETGRFMLDPSVTYEFASLLDGRFAIRSQSSSNATVKGLYIRDAFCSLYYINPVKDPNSGYTGDIVSLYADLTITRPQVDISVQSVQTSIRCARMGSNVISSDNPGDGIIYNSNTRTAHTPFANIGTEFAYSGSLASGAAQVDLSAWFDDRPPVMLFSFYLNRGANGYYHVCTPINRIMASDFSVTMTTNEGIYTVRMAATASSITILSRTYQSFDGSSTTPPGGALPVLQYVFHV